MDPSVGEDRGRRQRRTKVAHGPDKEDASTRRGAESGAAICSERQRGRLYLYLYEMGKDQRT